MAISPGEQWAINLTEGGYENHCRTADDLRKIKRLGLAWRRILGATGLAAPASVFEIGCGGGEKLATLALNGFAADGIDISPDVLDRAKQFFAEIGDIGGDPLRIGLNQGDFFAFDTDRRYDLVYHFGVVEHYLQADDRARFWDNAVKLTAPGGWVVSVVPCGRHLMRSRMRAEELCGYEHRLAEIDYSAASHRDEFARVGLVDVRVLPHGYFYFLSGHPSAMVRGLAFPPLFAIGNACLPWLPAPAALTERFAHSLIAIGRRPH
jgi:SAM-dependent methyltransferase